MQMDLRLLEDDDRTTRHIEALDDYGEHLAHAKAHVGQLDLGQRRAGLNQDLVLFSVLPELLDLEAVDEAHRPESFGNDLWQRLGLLLGLQIETAVGSRKNRLNRALALRAYVVGHLAGPQIETLGILPERTNVEDTFEHALEFEHEVRRERRILVVRSYLVRESIEAEGLGKSPDAAGVSRERILGRRQFELRLLTLLLGVLLFADREVDHALLSASQLVSK
jgi:hypothetical protein